jgi:N-acetylneuraminic acid mutarotase
MNKIIPIVLIFFFISGSFVAAFSPVSASELVEDTWSTITDMDQPRYGFEVVVLDGKIYAIGGCFSYEFLSTNERYDPKTDQWLTLAPMPTPRGNFVIVECQGKIYCMGGTTNDGPVNYSGPILFRQVDVVEVYDPVTNMWESKDPLPFSVVVEYISVSDETFKNSLQVQVINGQIFIMTFEGELYVYNPVTDKWSNKSPLLVKEEPLRAHVVNEQLFVITQSAMYLYNPVTDAWTNKAEMPASMTYVFSAVMDNKIIVGDFLYTAGSTNWSSIFSAQLRVRIYDTLSDVWYEGKTTDEHILAAHVNGLVTTIIITGVYAPKNVYVLGLESTKEDVYNLKPFTWVYDPVDDVWSTAKIADTAPYGWLGSRMIVVDDVFYIIGSGEFNFKYVPVGYDSWGYYDTRPSVTAPLVSNVASPNPSESEPVWSFLTQFVVIVAVLIVGVVTVTLFFYLRGRKNKALMLRMNKVLAFMLTFFFISGLFVTAFNSVSAELVGDSWNTKTSMSQARANLGVVAVDGKIWFFVNLCG